MENLSLTVPTKPTILSWNTTFRCNVRCQHCYASANDRGLKGELTTEEGEALIQDIASLGTSILVFSGGEPLMRSDILQLIQCSSTNGLIPTMGTNGFLLEKRASKLAEAGLKAVGVSLDAPIASQHDEFRGVTGSFDRAIRGVKAAASVGMRTQIHFTITQNTASQLEKMVDLAETLECQAIHVFFVVPEGRAKHRTDLSLVEWENALQRIYKRQLESDILIKPVCAPQYLPIFQKNLEQDNELAQQKIRKAGHFVRFKRGCLAGVSYARIDPIGNVTPCPYIRTSVGNVKETKFSELWKQAELFKQLRNGEQYKGKCTVCNHTDLCGGGCRARVLGMTGDLFAEEPWCVSANSE